MPFTAFRIMPPTNKGKWTIREDSDLIEIMASTQEWCQDRIDWRKVSEKMKTRNHLQCRQRWINHLSPDVKKAEWTDAEDKRIVHLFLKHGPHWSKFGKEDLLKGRSDFAIRTRFRSLLKDLNVESLSAKGVQESGENSIAKDLISERDAIKGLLDLSKPESDLVATHHK